MPQKYKPNVLNNRSGHTFQPYMVRVTPELHEGRYVVACAMLVSTL